MNDFFIFVGAFASIVVLATLWIIHGKIIEITERLKSLEALKKDVKALVFLSEGGVKLQPQKASEPPQQNIPWEK
ncbi:MAG: hypothetical protein HY921_04090 [Elusimicrobia bacterium]|nr:hypothetical protein [Elusimicrobiota bacterium]